MYWLMPSNRRENLSCSYMLSKASDWACFTGMALMTGSTESNSSLSTTAEAVHQLAFDLNSFAAYFSPREAAGV